MLGIFSKMSYEKGAALNVGSTAVWKLVSFANSIIIAAFFAAKSTDPYFYLNMVGGIATAFFISLNTSVIIPHSMHRPKEERAAFLNTFLLFYLALAVAAVSVCLLLPQAGLFFLSNFKVNFLYKNLLFNLAVVFFSLMLLAQFLISILETERYFGIAWLYPLNALIPLALLLCCRKCGVAVMFAGFITAQTVFILFCVYVLFKKIGWNKTCAPVKGKIWKDLGANALMDGGGAITVFIPMLLMSGFGTGFLSALNYAKQLFESPTEIITARIINVNRVSLNTAAARNKKRTLGKLITANLFWNALFIVPVAVFTSVFARDIITLFFKRGFFDETAVCRTALFVQLFMPWVILSLPNYQHRALAAATKQIPGYFKYQIPVFFFNMSFIFGFMLTVGPYGYPLSFIATYLVLWVVAAFMFKKLFPYINYFKTLLPLLGLCVLGYAAAIPALAVSFIKLPLLLKLFFAGIVYVGCYGLFAWAAYKNSFLRKRSF